MYFKNIFNIETEKVARLKKVERIERISELDSRYWTIEKHDEDNLLRAFPRFNMDTLSSDNSDDVVIKQEVLIAHNLMNTIISCESDNENTWNDDELTITMYRLASEFYLSKTPSISLNAIVTDNYNNPVPNVTLKFSISNDEEENIGESVSDKNGVCSVEFTPKQENAAYTAFVLLNNTTIVSTNFKVHNDLEE